MKDWTLALLALLLTLGFFSALGFMMAPGLSRDTAGSEALLTMLGSLGTGYHGAGVLFRQLGGVGG